MKKFTFFLLGAVLTGLTAVAAPISTQVKRADARKAETQVQYGQKAVNHASTVKKEGAKVGEVITSAKGTPVYYYQDNDALVYGEFYENYGNVSTILFAEDNRVYFYDLLPEAGFGTYTYGILEDDLITVELPQMVYYYNGYGYGFELSLLKLDNTSGMYVACEGSAQFRVYDDGDIILELPGEEIGEYTLGLIFSDDKMDAELCYLAMSFTPLEEQPETLPSDVETETYYFNDGLYGHPVQVGFDSEYLYLEGLEFMLPEWTLIKAKLEGDKGIIYQDQFVGVYYVYLNYTKCVILTERGYELCGPDAVVTLDIDRENKVITYAEGSPLLCINADVDELYELAIYNIFDLKVQDSFAGIPQNPYDLIYDTSTIDWYGYYTFMFIMNNLSTEGNVLDVNNMYYKIYIDGEPFVFEEDYYTGDYFGIGETENVPYLFENGNDFYAMLPYLKEIGFYIDGFDTIGVQTFYDYEGVLTESALVTLNLITGEVTEEGGTGARVEMTPSGSVVRTEYFNLQGQKISKPDKGIYIKRSILEDGSSINKLIGR